MSLLFVFALTPSAFAQTTDTDLPSPGILPDSPIYFLKPFSEKIRGMFTFGEDNKAKYALTLVVKRLSEAKALFNKGKDDLAGDTIEQVGIENENAQKHLAKAETGGKDVTAVVKRLETNSNRQQAVLQKVLDKAPKNVKAKAAIQRAMEMSQKGLTKAQEMQNKEKGKPENRGKPERKGMPSGGPEKPNNEKPSNLQKSLGGGGQGGQGGQGQGNGKQRSPQGQRQGSQNQGGPENDGQPPITN